LKIEEARWSSNLLKDKTMEADFPIDEKETEDDKTNFDWLV
jgi:hypothetical protein